MLGDGPVYVPVASETHRWLQCVDEADFRALSWGELLPLGVRLVTETERGAALRETGLPHLASYVLTMTAAVRDSIGPLLEGQGLVIPLRSGDGDFWMFVPDVCDVLDEAASTVTRFSSGRVMHVSGYEFHADRLADRTVFRIPQVPRQTLFCTQRLVDALSGQDGVGFKRVWPAA
ncbi:hypothetical protein [Actinoplanes sp. L3-i22]|uniref:hypothetical protein n=1 Tax=Actinoplanes sp. L3-i22 TaxID=2836373 RepID=UPI001C73E5FC|nr:hypothetical protein [Actinoplanes sp. L3-i22]BCY08611.1 hypothetical protein L3i22_036990 [Actinoplanes sp. L3-i22]